MPTTNLNLHFYCDTCVSPKMAKIHQNTLMFYTVEDGDTLPKIAEKVYGDRSLWEQIYDANPDVIVLHPGVTVFIPYSIS